MADQGKKDFLIQRAIRFFSRYGAELETVRQLLEVRLNQLCLAYTLNQGIPRESVHVSTRTKTLASFLGKLEKKGYPTFYYPTEIAMDLIGGRIVCWFVDDCYGIFDIIKSSKHIELVPGSEQDYITTPKSTGYRSIHLLANMKYDRIRNDNEKRVVVDDKMIVEIQIRSKLQDAWAEFTHEVHYKVPERFEPDYEVLVSEIANRLSSEDKSALAIRNILKKKTEEKRHEGLRDEFGK
jgi:putative GTP pyrophosphokinase